MYTTPFAAEIDHWRTFMDHSPAVAWMKDARGRHVYLSQPYIEMIGVPCDDWFGKTDFELWPANVAEKFQELDQQVLRSGDAVQYEDDEHITFPNGKKRTWWVTKFPFHDATGSSYVGGIAVDITAQKNTQQALRRQHAVSERLIDAAHNIVLVLDKAGRIVRFNSFMEQLVGFPLSDVQGRHWADVYLPSADREDLSARFQLAIHNEHHRGHILPIVTSSGQTLIIEWYNSQLFDSDGCLEGLLCIGADTTQRRSMERQIEQIAEAEQCRIGQELHDGIGQELTALRIFSEHLVEQLDDLRRSTPTTPHVLAPLETLASKVAQGLQMTSDNLQKLSRSMASTNVGSETLQVLLANLAATTDALPNIRCLFHCIDTPQDINNIAAGHLYRIAQEAVNNAIKHSSPTCLELMLRTEPMRTILEISDDGIGFSEGGTLGSTETRSSGVGLQVMYFRADLIGADLTIEENSHGGTSVICTIRSCPE